MITEKMIAESIAYLMESWGEEVATKVIAECEKSKGEYMTADNFFDNCIACGGNWTGMLLTGIKKLFPSVWEVIPNDMGKNAFNCLCYTLILCNVDTSV